MNINNLTCQNLGTALEHHNSPFNCMKRQTLKLATCTTFGPPWPWPWTYHHLSYRLTPTHQISFLITRGFAENVEEELEILPM